MSTFRDGPADGVTLVNARAPWFLRIVVDPEGKVDCLDQVGDEPADGEGVFVYEAIPGTHVGPALVRMTRPNRCVWMQMGDYRHRADVDGEQLRETAAWQEWTRAQPHLRLVSAGETAGEPPESGPSTRAER